MCGSKKNRDDAESRRPGDQLRPCVTAVGGGSFAKAVKVKVTQSCPTLCDPMIYIVHGILQARTLEWVASPFSRGSSQPRDRIWVSHIAGGFSTS